MNTNQETSTPDADICGELRTMSGQNELRPVPIGTCSCGKPATVECRTLLSPGVKSDPVLCCEDCWKNELPKLPDQPAPAPSERPTPMPTVYENRGGEVWERHADGRRELFAADIIARLTTLERELAEARERLEDNRRMVKESMDALAEASEAAASETRWAAQYKRERDDARELIAVKDQSLHAASVTIHMNNELMAQGSQKIDELREQRDRLAEALLRAEKHCAKAYAHTVATEESDHVEDEGWVLLCEIRAALAAVKGGQQ